MDKIETPEDREILQFLNKLADYCIPMDGGKMRMTAQVWSIIKVRDAVIRADERRKAAGRLLADMEEWKNIAGLGGMLTDMLAMWITKRIKAAIMAEPEEAQG